MAIVFIFGLILIFSPMTELRGESTVGQLDIAMVILATITFLLCFGRSDVISSSAESQSPFRNLYQEPVARFWIWTTPILLASTLINVSGGNSIFLAAIGRDALAWSATIVTTIAVSAALMSRHRLALAYGFCFGSFVIALGYSAAALTGVVGYSEDNRFVGLSLNPNQTALHALVIITTCYFANRALSSSSRIFRFVLVVSIVCAFIFGFATQSDSFRLASIPIILTFTMALFERLLGNRTKAVSLIIFTSFVGILLLEYWNPGFIAHRLDSATSGLQDGNQDIDRITLWKNGIAAWQENILYGNGIGAWSGISGPFEGVESHNNIIDWLSIVGIAGALIFARLIININSFNIYKYYDRYFLLLAFIIFGMFGFFFRSPIYWCSISIILYRVYKFPKRIKMP